VLPKKKNVKRVVGIFARRQWLMPVILATQEAEITRIKVRCWRRHIVCKTLFKTNPSQRAGGVAHDVGPEFKSQCLPLPKKFHY
jgi:hypothetical protein